MHKKIYTYDILFMCIGYRDRRVERQRRWTEELFRRLATLPLSDFVPLNSHSSP